MKIASTALLTIAMALLLPACGARSATGGADGAGGASSGGQGGAGGGGAVVGCPPYGSAISAELSTQDLEGKPCGASPTCAAIGYCDSCKVACVNGVWQKPLCTQAGPNC